MKKIFFVLSAAVCMICLLSACSIQEMRNNRENLQKLQIGMTQDQVREIMGEPLDEVFSSGDIWFYYTEYKWMDGMNTRDECTPVMFDEDGKLIGTGYEFYKNELDKNPMNRRRLDPQL